MKILNIRSYILSACLFFFSGQVMAIVANIINNQISPGENFYKRANGNLNGRCLDSETEQLINQERSECIREKFTQKDDMVGIMYESLMNANSMKRTLEEINKIFSKIDNIKNQHEILEMVAYSIN